MAGEPMTAADQGGLAREQPGQFGFVIGRIDRMIRRRLTKRLAALDLSLPDYTVLSVLDREPGISGAEVARRTLVSPQAINEMITSLERREMIERSVDPGHARVLQMRLTGTGAVALGRAREIVAELEAEAFEGLSDDERQRLLSLLWTCAENIGAGVKRV